MRVDRFYQWFVPRVVTPLAERAGHPRWTTARHLAREQWRPREELDQAALGRLRTLLEHAARHVPYYRGLFERTKVDGREVTSLADLARLPVSSKLEMRGGFPAETVAENIPAARRQPMMTSGSTGRPFEFYWDRAAVPALGGTDWFWLQWAGTAPWHTRLVVASPAYFYDRLTPPRPWRRLVNRIALGERTERLSADQLSTEDFRSLVARAARRGPYFMRGYPGTLATLAAMLSGEGKALPAYPRVVVTFAETATAANVELIRETFRCPVVNYYSSWEVPQIAQTCPDNAEVLHVNAERIIVRIVRPDGGDAAPGETGRVVVTDLANYVMPFINYAPGDWAMAGAPCPCGRGLPTLGRLEGREGEMIRTPHGRHINGVVLGQFLAFVAGIIPYVWEYQAEQTSANAVLLRVAPTPRFTEEYRRSLERALADYLGPDMAVTVEPVGHIPLAPSGKRQIIVPLPGREPSAGGAESSRSR